MKSRSILSTTLVLVSLTSCGKPDPAMSPLQLGQEVLIQPDDTSEFVELKPAKGSKFSKGSAAWAWSNLRLGDRVMVLDDTGKGLDGSRPVFVRALQGDLNGTEGLIERRFLRASP